MHRLRYSALENPALPSYDRRHQPWSRAGSRKLLDVELSIRGILRGFGLKVGQVTRKTFEARIWELVTGHTTLERIAEAMLSACATLQAQYEELHKAVLAFVREDAVCRRLMTVPGVGPVVAVTFKSAVDAPCKLSKKLHSPLSSIRRIIQTRGRSCADPTAKPPFGSRLTLSDRFFTPTLIAPRSRFEWRLACGVLLALARRRRQIA